MAEESFGQVNIENESGQVFWYNLTDKLSPKLVSIFAIIGIVYALLKSSKFLRYLYKRFIRAGYDLHQRYGGGWAVVTGASDGIGYEYANRLAARGFDVILIARNEEKLKFRIDELKKLHPKSEFKHIVFDFEIWYLQDAYWDLFEKLDKVEGEISVLVNNVGILNFKPFEAKTHEEIDREVKVNTTSVLHLTRHLIPRFLKRNSRSLIINIGAGFGLNGMVGVSVYGATKAFVHNLSESLEKQYRGRIDVIKAIPCPVHTNMNPEGLKVPMSISTTEHVNGILKDVGYESATSGHYKHDILTKMTHSWLFEFAMNKEFENWDKKLEQLEKCLDEKKKTDPYYSKKHD